VKEQRNTVRTQKTQKTQKCAKLRKLRLRAKNRVTDKVSMQKSCSTLHVQTLSWKSEKSLRRNFTQFLRKLRNTITYCKTDSRKRKSQKCYCAIVDLRILRKNAKLRKLRFYNRYNNFFTFSFERK